MNDHAATAVRIHRDRPVVDGHNDLPWALRTRAGGDLDNADPSGPLPDYHTDIPRMLEGGIGAQFWSVYVPAWSEHAFARTNEQIALVKEMVARNPDHLALATTAGDARRITESGRIASLLGAEGGHSIENSLENLADLAEQGVRYLTLTHADTIEWADSGTDELRHDGLTEFGLDVIDAMNDHGMLVDISHVSDDVMRQAIERSRSPVIASHSSARALADHPRNIPDDILEMVGATGGVVMVNFYSGFVVPESAGASRDMFDQQRQLMAELKDERAVDEAMAELSRGRIHRGTVDHVIDHIEHVANIAGFATVGLGSDYDGVDTMPVGLEDVSCYPAITEALLGRGWGESDIRDVLGRNALRVLEAAEDAVG